MRYGLLVEQCSCSSRFAAGVCEATSGLPNPQEVATTEAAGEIAKNRRLPNRRDSS